MDMGIEKLTGSLVTEAQAEATEIVKTAKWHVETMLKSEQEKIDSLKDEAKKQVEGRLEEQRNERLAWARLEAKRIIAESKEDAISYSLEGFFSELKGIRKDKLYKTFLKNGVLSAVKELGGKTKIHIVKGDSTTLGKVNGCKIISDLDSFGGAIVESEDDSVRIDLRLETLFELQRDTLRKEIYGRLFGND
jgi:vacuolar-type H+-ATPase subunit E/Vma4